MSLVDYASSDDDVSEEDEKSDEPVIHISKLEPHNQPVIMPNQASETNAESPNPSFQLPDASLLLNSATSSSVVSGSDHSSRVAAAMAANASRKRDTVALSSSLPRSKVPKSTFPHSKNVPDTVGRLLVPPQLTGRSNIVTEDINKLFVKKSSKPSSQ